MVLSSKGQVSVPQVIFGVLVIFLVLVVGIAALNSNNSLDGFNAALSSAITSVSDTVMNISGPIFRLLLGLDRVSDTNNQFLIVLTFILISIIIVGTLNTANIFGDNDSPSGQFINFAVGIIVSIIGVRFMPLDLWASLAAPSSAFVATVLVGLPFLAMFFVSMKARSHLVRKLLWLFYMVVMIYLVFSIAEDGGFKWVYLSFLGLAAIMMFFDSTVRRYFWMEKRKLEVEDAIGELNMEARFDLRKKIEKLQQIIGDPAVKGPERGRAQAEINRLTRLYGKLSSI